MAELAESSINQRIKFLIESELQTNTHKLSKLLNVSDGTLRNYVDGKSKPGADFLEKMIERIDGLDANWLLTGKGQPITHRNISISEESTRIYGKSFSDKASFKTVDLGIVEQGEHSDSSEDEYSQGMVVLTVREYQLLQGQLLLLKDQLLDKERIIQLLENQLSK